jgi:methylenetetrahydrofolate dehydrogenase (NADP+) / methenyltetrahydrofolate cyclohydrolase
MDLKLIDGKSLAQKHEQKLKKYLAKLNGPRVPSIVSFCNLEDPPSVKYTEMKKRKANDIGMFFYAENYDTSVSKELIADKIRFYNERTDIDGIMVQLPLPEHLNIIKEDLLNLIDPNKDIDGLTEISPYVSATVKGVVSILKSLKLSLKEMTFVVVGSNGQVGREMVRVLNDNRVKVLEVDQDDSRNKIKQGQIVISCTGQNGIILPSLIKKGAVLIDVGLGDFDPECFKKASRYTPIVGGVGPMTVISLMENAVESFEKRVLK